MAAETQLAESCRSDGAGIVGRKDEERYARQPRNLGIPTTSDTPAGILVLRPRGACSAERTGQTR